LKYKILNLLFIFSLINIFNVHAFFMRNDHPDEIRIDHTIVDRPTQGNNVFQLHDNFFFNNTNSFLVEKNNNFIHADEIKINVPLAILARNSIYPEDSIDRILLANLRIKKLISEYNELQKKAKLILQDNKMPGTGKIHNSKANSKEKEKTVSIESEREKINKKLFNISRLAKLTQADTLSDETIFLEDFSKLKNNLTNPLQNIIVDNIGFAKVIEGNPELGETQIDTGMPVILKNDKNALPWIFRIFLKILNYAIGNRVEIILYMIFITIIGYFIALQVKQ